MLFSYGKHQAHQFLNHNGHSKVVPLFHQNVTTNFKGACKIKKAQPVWPSTTATNHQKHNQL